MFPTSFYDTRTPIDEMGSHTRRRLFQTRKIVRVQKNQFTKDGTHGLDIVSSFLGLSLARTTVCLRAQDRKSPRRVERRC